MGLLYQFPSQLDAADDRIDVDDGILVLKTYGLPSIFWGYLVAIFSILFFLYLASRELLMAMLEGGDPINRMLAVGVGLVMGGLIPVFLGIFFYEKILYKRERDLKIVHRFFGIPFKRSRHQLLSADAFEIKHCLDSPNIARGEQREGSRGFQNNGFYRMQALLGDNVFLMVDRHSQRRELDRLKKLLCQY